MTMYQGAPPFASKQIVISTDGDQTIKDPADDEYVVCDRIIASIPSAGVFTIKHGSTNLLVFSVTDDDTVDLPDLQLRAPIGVTMVLNVPTDGEALVYYHTEKKQR